MTWLRRQLTGWHPAATAAATCLLVLSPVAGFLVGDASRPHPAVAETHEFVTPSSSTTSTTGPRRTTTTTRSQTDHTPTPEREVTMPSNDSADSEAPRPEQRTTAAVDDEAPTTTIDQTTTTEPAPTTTQPPVTEPPPPPGGHPDPSPTLPT